MFTRLLIHPGPCKVESAVLTTQVKAVGFASFNGTFEGFVENAGIYGIINFPGSTSSFASKINNLGEIGGGFFDGLDEQGFVESNNLLYYNKSSGSGVQLRDWHQ